MATCPACGKDLPGEFPFCPFCAAPLDQPPATAPAEERKVVSVLFCDLVGFTAASDQQDPEDVRARVRPYHARLRQEIERYGGTVEKFVGDAVMAVFGAPVAHEDDAERAVRSGLRILEAIEELNETDQVLELQVRVGINTGEAVVALGARPEQGEGIVTGDVVNTASRLEAAAPVNGVAVGELTFKQTERVFVYEPLEPVNVKGKAEPVPLWRARSARARFGSDVTRTHATPLVGRELERSLLEGTFERALRDRSVQLVTIVGEPGVGKSRLVAELFSYIDNHPELTTWRQGRCLPYGEGIAFWALGEIVKAEAGILESDSPAEAAAKLEQALNADDPDREWLKARLSPLVGAGGEPAAQEESFAAWRRFLEWLAAEGPAVFVFEDLHWADEALLSFIEHLADWSEGVPLTLICTARPELDERHPHFGSAARNAQRVNLAPLSDEDTARLLALLLERAVLPAETQRLLLERAGGNPLYAEEFVRLLKDRELLSAPLEEVPFPDSVQALIAARLDTLAAERKNLLQDAAVVGKVFWAGALAAMGERDTNEVRQTLHELARKELVRSARVSSMEGESEYAFWHLLVRDVCYAQIPRVARAVKHRAAAAWIEAKGGERADDFADVLAHHYLRALELHQAAGEPDQSKELEALARRFLVLAGERALPLDVGSAEASLGRALELAPPGHPERAAILERWAQAAQQAGRLQEAKEALAEALSLDRERGDQVAAGRALSALALALRQLGDPGHLGAAAEGVAVLEGEAPSSELVAAYAQLAAARFLRSTYPEAIAAAERALELAAKLGLEQPARALGYRGSARTFLGDSGGLEDMRLALALAVEQGKGRDAAVLYNNLSIALWQYHGPAAALESCREGAKFCERRGIAELALVLAGTSLSFLLELGRSEDALVQARQLATKAETAGDIPTLTDAISVQLRLSTWRGETGQAAGLADPLVTAARESGEPSLIGDAFAAAAQLLMAQGQADAARPLLAELEQTPHVREDVYFVERLPELVRSVLALADRSWAAHLLDGVEPLTPLHEHVLSATRAAVAEADGDHEQAAALYGEAAARWQAFGNLPERAHALLGQGRCLLALGRPSADVSLAEARQLFASIGYRPALEEAEALLSEATAAAS